VHSEITRDNNYHDYHANDVEDVHFVSSSCGAVHLRIYTALKTKQNCLVSTTPPLAACHGEAAELSEIAQLLLMSSSSFFHPTSPGHSTTD
jgi:hypothetical protein